VSIQLWLSDTNSPCPSIGSRVAHEHIDLKIQSAEGGRKRSVHRGQEKLQACCLAISLLLFFTGALCVPSDLVVAILMVAQAKERSCQAIVGLSVARVYLHGSPKER
jgi:hypothetical protein